MARRGNPIDPDELQLPRALDDDLPKGDQLRKILLDLISGLEAGAPLPSERGLAERYSVARMTVRGEIRKLAADGVVRILPGVGIVVADPPAPSFGIGRPFGFELSRRGQKAGSIIQEHNVFRVTSEVAQRLEVPTGGRALRLALIRTADGLPTGIERTTISLERFPGLESIDFEQEPLDRIIETRYGIRPTSAQARVAAVRPTAEETELLGIDATVPCLLITATTRDSSGQVIDYSKSIYRGDRFDLEVSQRSSSSPIHLTAPYGD